MKTRVVHCRREAYDVYIGRPSQWGNPFKLTDESKREEVVEKYRKWIVRQPAILAEIASLKGKVLGCWCAPKLCHGDVLAELADKVADK